MAKILSSSAVCGTAAPALEKKEKICVAQLPIVMAAMLAAVPTEAYQSSGSPGRKAQKASSTDPQKSLDMETDSTVDAWSTDELLSSSSDSDAEAEEVCSRGNSEATVGASQKTQTPEPINVAAWGGVGLRLLACLQDDSDDEF